MEEPQNLPANCRLAPATGSAACVRCNRDASGEMMWPDIGDNYLCQECWEAECSRLWWQMVNEINDLYWLQQPNFQIYDYRVKPEPREWDAWLMSDGTIRSYAPCGFGKKIRVREVLE